MVSLTRKAVLLQKRKHQAALLRRQGEREFKKAQFIANRSASGLVSLQRRIDSSKEELEDVSGNLNRKTAQEESIQRLISSAEDKLRREEEAKNQTEQEIEIADTEEEKKRAISRLKIISESIDELQEEIKQRNRTFIKVAESIEEKELEVPVFSDEDIQLVCQQANADEEKAKNALVEAKGDLARAILLLQNE